MLTDGLDIIAFMGEPRKWRDRVYEHLPSACLPIVSAFRCWLSASSREWRVALPPRSFVVLCVGCAWLLYGLYEVKIQREIKPESVPIRVDLLFLGPALALITVLGAAAYFVGFPRPAPDRSPR